MLQHKMWYDVLLEEPHQALLHVRTSLLSRVFGMETKAGSQGEAKFSGVRAFMRFQEQSQARHMQPDKPTFSELATSHRGRGITSQLEHLRKEFDQR